MSLTTVSRPLSDRAEIAIKIFFLFSILIRILFTWNRAFNADEFQHLHNAWMIHLGFLPYHDFWDNHTPLLHYSLAPILAAIGEGTFAVFVARFLLSLSALGILWIVYKIASMLLDKQHAWLAVLLLSISDIFLQKTIEIRPDQFLVLFWMLSLWFCLRNASRFFIGGILLGIGMLFSPKAVLCLTAAFLVFFFIPKQTIAQRFKQQTLYVLGVSIPVAALAAVFFSKGLLNELISWTFIQNVTYPDIRSSIFLFYPQNLSFFLLAFAGMLVWFFKNKTLRHPVSLLLLIGAALFLLVAFAMPGTFAQAGLMFQPLFAIAAAIAMMESFQKHHWIFRGLALTAGLIIPLISIFATKPLAKTNAAQIARMEWILRNTSSEDSVFDGNCAYVFRKQAFYFGSLVDGIRYGIERGTIPLSIPENLKSRRCKVVIYDDRVSDLSEPIQQFLRANYIDSGHYDVFLAGKKLSSENFTGSRATFRIEIPAVYKIETNAKSFRLDGKDYTAPVTLYTGTHQISAIEDFSFVNVVAVEK